MATSKVVTKKSLADDLSVKYGWTKKDANEAVSYVFDEIAAVVKKRRGSFHQRIWKIHSG